MTDPTELALAAIDEAFKAHISSLFNVMHSVALAHGTTPEMALERATTGYQVAVKIRETMQAVVKGEKTA